MPRRGFYEGWTTGLQYGQQSRRQALEEELSRGRMMLEQAAEERAMRREKFMEQVQREKGYEDDLASYRRLSELYPEAGAEGQVQQMHEFSRRLAENPEATVEYPDVQEAHRMEDVRARSAEELMARFGQAKLGGLEAQRKAKMGEVLAKAGMRPGAVYMKDVEGMRKEAARLRQFAQYFSVAESIETDPVTGAVTKMSRRADFPGDPAKQAALDREARKMVARAQDLDARADRLSQQRLGSRPGPVDAKKIAETLAIQGFTAEEIQDYLSSLGVQVQPSTAPGGER